MDKSYKQLIDCIEKNRDKMLSAFQYIWQHPEIGYKEWLTSGYLEAEFIRLGYRLSRAGDIPGFTALLDTGRPGPRILILGELDALICATHPEADQETGAVHACGHLIQTASMLGVAAALKEPGMLEELSGSILFAAVPAEETIDLEYRNQLIQQGIIRYVAGKIEFLYRGYFEGVDLALMFHAGSHQEKLFELFDGMDGCITKHMVYRGVAAHAGGAPHKGVNALYAASLGLQACNSLRETFREQDYVRYHPIITSGGSATNVIPDLVKMDTYVRAASFDKMLEVNYRIDRALAASAAALGAQVTVKNKPGNLPLHSDIRLNRLCEQVIESLFGPGQILYGGWDTQSSDVGDLSALMPVIQPLCMGAAGNQHGEDYRIEDKEKCIMNPARVLSCMIFELLRCDAAYAKEVIREYQPRYPLKEDYFKAIGAVEFEGELVAYQGNGDVTLILNQSVEGNNNLRI